MTCSCGISVRSCLRQQLAEQSGDSCTDRQAERVTADCVSCGCGVASDADLSDDGMCARCYVASMAGAELPVRPEALRACGAI